MRVAMLMRHDGVTIDQYEQIRKAIDLDANFPQGAVVHMVTHDGNGLRISDVWESADDLNAFAKDRLMPALHQAGITAQPQIEVYPLHALLSPELVG